MVVSRAVAYHRKAVGSMLWQVAPPFDSPVAFSDHSKDPDAALSLCNLSCISSLAGSWKDSFDRPVFLFTLE